MCRPPSLTHTAALRVPSSSPTKVWYVAMASCVLPCVAYDRAIVSRASGGSAPTLSPGIFLIAVSKQRMASVSCWRLLSHRPYSISNPTSRRSLARPRRSNESAADIPCASTVALMSLASKSSLMPSPWVSAIFCRWGSASAYRPCRQRTSAMSGEMSMSGGMRSGRMDRNSSSASLYRPCLDLNCPHDVSACGSPGLAMVALPR
mmetsp:Transcript_51994/g.130648  ORF Transcript_51994/g.130648 Transcript_51994/m.130648 type:complete len:205 (+) Transcript_51994:1663-2277(+)